MLKIIHVKVNGKEEELAVDVRECLTDTLRDRLGLTSVKKGCEVGECGACTVILEGEAVDSCIVLAASVEGKHVTTVEGLAKNGKLDPVQQAVLDHHALQCGFCTPGFLMSAKALLDKKPNPTRDEIKTAIAGNLCRCTGYQQLVEAFEDAAKEYQKG